MRLDFTTKLFSSCVEMVCNSIQSFLLSATVTEGYYEINNGKIDVRDRSREDGSEPI